MFLELEKDFVEQLKVKNVLSTKVIEDLNSHYRYSDIINIDYDLFTLSEIKEVYNIAKEMKKRSCMMQISTYVNLIESPQTAKVSNIKAFSAADSTQEPRRSSPVARRRVPYSYRWWSAGCCRRWPSGRSR